MSSQRPRCVVLIQWTFLSSAASGAFILLSETQRIVLAAILLGHWALNHSLIWQSITSKILHPVQSKILSILEGITDIVANSFASDRQAGNFAMGAAGNSATPVPQAINDAWNSFANVFHQSIGFFAIFLLWWLTALFAVYHILASGLTIRRALVSMVILTLATFGHSVYTKFGLSLPSIVYSIYKKFMSYQDDRENFMTHLQNGDKVGAGSGDKYMVSQEPEADYEFPYPSKIYERTAQQLTATRIMTRPSIIQVFLPVNLFSHSTSATEDMASIALESLSPKITDTASASKRNTPLKGAIPSTSIPTPTKRSVEKWWNKFIHDESDVASGLLHSEASKYESAKTSASTSVVESLPTKNSSGFIGRIFGIKKGIKSVQSELPKPVPTTAERPSMSIENEDDFLSLVHKGLSEASTKEGRVIEEILSVSEEAKSATSKVVKQFTSAQDKAISETSKAAEKISSATEKVKHPTSKFVLAHEAEAEMEESTFIVASPKPKLSKIQGIIGSVKSSASQVVHTVTDKIKDNTLENTKTISAQVTDHPHIVAESDHDDYGNVPEQIPIFDAYSENSLGKLGSVAASSFFGLLNIFSNSIPRTLGIKKDYLHVPHQSSPLRWDPIRCTSCAIKTLIVYTCTLLIAIFATPYLRAIFFRTKYKPWSPVAALFAATLWTPISFMFLGSIIYQKYTLLASIIDYFCENPYLLVFAVLFSLKALKSIVHAFSYHILSHPHPIPQTPQIVHWHVTVIIPYKWTTATPSAQYKACIESIIPNSTYHIILLTKSLAARLAAEKFAAYYGNWSIEVAMCQTGDARTRLLHAASKVETPITVLVKDGSVNWPLNFLRNALAPFDDATTALVAPSFRPYLLPASAHDQPQEPQQLPSPPPDPPTFKQRFFLALQKRRYRLYNFTNTATYNLDGGVSPSSQKCLLVRTDLLHTPHFQNAYLASRLGDEESTLTRYVQKSGFKTVFLNQAETVLDVGIALPPPTFSLAKYAATNILRAKRMYYRDIFSSLIHDRSTYRAHPWTTFANLVWGVIEVPLVIDLVMPWALLRGGGEAWICHFYATLGALRLLRSVGELKRGKWVGFMGWWWCLLGWDVVVEGLVGAWALVTFWK